MRKRCTYAQQTVLAYMYQGESYAEAKQRLDDLWKKGEHPTQQGKTHEN